MSERGRRREDDADVRHEDAHARERAEDVAVRHPEDEEAGRRDARRDEDDEELAEDVAGEDARDPVGEVLGGAAALEAQDLRDGPAVLLAVLEHEEGEHRDRGRVEEERDDRLDLERDLRERVERVRLEPHGARAAVALGQQQARALLELREDALRLRREDPDLRLVQREVAREGLDLRHRVHDEEDDERREKQDDDEHGQGAREAEPLEERHERLEREREEEGEEERDEEDLPRPEKSDDRRGREHDERARAEHVRRRAGSSPSRTFRWRRVPGFESTAASV